MRYILLLLTLTSCTMLLHSAEKEFTTPTTVPQKQWAREIRLQFEVDENDIKEYGLQLPALQTELATRLSLGQIQVKDDPNAPLLILRTKSVHADRAIATFVQLAFFEEATLTRNNSRILAMTWSQATMIAGPKEDFVKEVTQSVVSMTNAFILDYQKAMAPPN